MDMKKILQAMDGAKAKAEVNSSDMKKFLRVVAEGAPVAPQQSPEQIAYNQLRVQLDSADSLRGGANTYTDVSPEVAASTAAMKQKLAQMAAALKLKGIDAEAEYNAPDANVPAAAPTDLNKYNDQDAVPVAEEVGMSRLLSIISEGKGPLNRSTTAEAMTMQHYAEKKTITNPVLNVQEGAKPSMIGKYFKAVEQELNEAAERSKDRSRQLAERVSTKINELSPDTLASYKKKAGADASKADKEGNFKRGDKRFSGIVKATKKELDNDVKKHAMSEDLEELLDLRNKVEEAIKQRLDPACWDNKKIGNPKTKVKGGVRVNNCVPKEAVNPAQQAAIAIAKKKAGKK